MTESFPPLTARLVFVVRVWREPYQDQAGRAGEWRGSVEMLGTGKKVYFRDISQTSQIIATMLGEILKEEDK